MVLICLDTQLNNWPLNWPTLCN